MKDSFKILGLLVALATAWLVWSGLYKPLLLSLGVFSCFLVLMMAHRIDFFDKNVFSLHLWYRLPRYWGWLFKEIFISSWNVACIVLNPRLPISPTVVILKDIPDGSVGQVILGNAITLTPGTATIDIIEGRMKVHCLTKDGADDLFAGEMNRRTNILMGG